MEVQAFTTTGALTGRLELGGDLATQASGNLVGIAPVRAEVIDAVAMHRHLGMELAPPPPEDLAEYLRSLSQSFTVSGLKPIEGPADVEALAGPMTASAATAYATAEKLYNKLEWLQGQKIRGTVPEGIEVRLGWDEANGNVIREVAVAKTGQTLQVHWEFGQLRTVTFTRGGVQNGPQIRFWNGGRPLWLNHYADGRPAAGGAHWEADGTLVGGRIHGGGLELEVDLVKGSVSRAAVAPASGDKAGAWKGNGTPYEWRDKWTPLYTKPSGRH
jgi:hypothetical protein